MKLKVENESSARVVFSKEELNTLMEAEKITCRLLHSMIDAKVNYLILHEAAGDYKMKDEAVGKLFIDLGFYSHTDDPEYFDEE